MTLRPLFCLFFEWPLKTGFTVVYRKQLISTQYAHIGVCVCVLIRAKYGNKKHVIL